MAFGMGNPFEKKPQEAGADFGWNDKLNKEMAEDGDKTETYGEGKVEGIEAVFVSVAGSITVMLRNKTEEGTAQLHKDFSREARAEAEALFAELKKQIDAVAESGEGKDAVYSRTESLFN